MYLLSLTTYGILQKSTIKLLATNSVIGIIVLTLSILLIVSSIITDALVFEHGACEEVFGCSPKEFLNGDFPLSDQLHGRYAYAFVNSKDELEIYFTDKQKEAALELELFQDLQEIQNNSRIEVALDYKKFTIIVYDDKVGLNDFEVIINNANKILFFIVHIFIQPLRYPEEKVPSG